MYTAVQFVHWFVQRLVLVVVISNGQQVYAPFRPCNLILKSTKTDQSAKPQPLTDLES